MEYLTKKWKMWYNSLDVNHDSKISIEDVKESMKKFTNQLVGDKAKGVKVSFEDWWNKYIFRNEVGKEILESEFVQKLKESYKSDKTALKNEMQACFDCIFDVIDANKDRNIDLVEYVNAFRAFGHENEPLVRKIFSLRNVNPDNEVVPLKDIVADWVRFVTEEDSNVEDIIMEAFKEGL